MNDSVRTLCAVSLFSALIVTGCATTKVVSSVNYDSERSIRYEIDTTRQYLDKDPVEALARAWALRENTSGYREIDDLFSSAGERAEAEFESAISSARWTDALVLYRSLETLSIPPAGWSEASLQAKRADAWKAEGNRTLATLDQVQNSTPEDEAPSSGIVSRMIKGTVTVWVDRGLRIENGVGYADRVIGSGFFIDSRGYFITNYHVIESEVDPKYEGYSRLYIKLPSDSTTRIPAKVIGWDPVLDLALVKTEIDPPAVFQLGSSEDLKIGNRIYAIGSPAGLEQTLTAGIVSAQKRRLLSLGDVLQIDAPINHGNSGGPIVDEAGRVQAVVFAGIESFEGLNFAIPVELLRIILPSLYAGGKVSHPWLGAWGKTTALPGSAENAGVTVVYSIPGSPCEIAGIPEGSVILAVNGKPVKTLEELQYTLIREEPRTIVKLTGIPPQKADNVSSDAKATRDWFVMLSSRPEVPGQKIFDADLQSRALLPLFGLDLERVGTTKQYVVKSLVRGSIADEAGFSEQDVIEIREMKIDSQNQAVAIQLLTKKRKAGYLDSFIGLQASLDSPSYF
jgi:S1-C subfamily serine protease